jgi:hypothetical protein
VADFDKADVVAAFLARVAAELAALEQMTRMSRDEATSGEAKAENKYDTRATEASYLAAGQGQRLLSLRRLVALLETQPGACELYELEGSGGPVFFLLAPDGGGTRLKVAGRDVVVVTTAAPVGLALTRARDGGTVKLGGQEYEVMSVG